MHLLYCDESNLDKRKGDFLIYGGLVIEAEQAHKLSLAIDELRSRFAVPRDYRLKMNPGPSAMSHQQFIQLKAAALKLAWEHGARLIVYVILHDIATSPDEARRNGINTVCYHFHCILNRVGGPGLVLIDRFQDERNEIEHHLREKFIVGLTNMPHSSEIRLSNILGFHYSAIGQSHFPSIIDIALGSLRFALNTCTREETQNQDTAEAMLAILTPMFWKEIGKTITPELGFMFSPKHIKRDHLLRQYLHVQDFLSKAGMLTEQRITGGSRALFTPLA